MISSNVPKWGFDIPIFIHRHCNRTFTHSTCKQRPSPRHKAPIFKRQPQSRTYARQTTPPSSTSKQSPQRTLEKPTRFNPPSHGSRRPRPAQNYPGPRLSDAEAAARKTKRYPNSMPSEGTFSHWFLTNRGLHVWISLSTLTCLAGYTMLHSFVTTTEFRDELPAAGDFLAHPLAAPAQFVRVYKMHVWAESQKTRAKRHEKTEDAKKRHEFLRAHGVEPGFLTGSWMGKFGTVEGEKFREELAAKKALEEEEQERAAAAAEAAAQVQQLSEEEQQPRQKRRVKRWFGIWE